MLNIKSFKVTKHIDIMLDNSIVFKTTDGSTYRWNGNIEEYVIEKYIIIFATKRGSEEETEFKISYDDIKNNKTLNAMLVEMETIREKSVKQMFYDRCWYYKHEYDIDKRVIDNSHTYLWEIRRPVRYELTGSECKCEQCQYKNKCNRLNRKIHKKQKEIENKIKAEIKSVFDICETHNDFIENVGKILDKYFTKGFNTKLALSTASVANDFERYMAFIDKFVTYKNKSEPDIEEAKKVVREATKHIKAGEYDKVYDYDESGFNDRIHDLSDSEHIDLHFSNLMYNPKPIIVYEHLKIDTIVSRKTIEDKVSFEDINISYSTIPSLRKFNIFDRN